MDNEQEHGNRQKWMGTIINVQKKTLILKINCALDLQLNV